MKTLIPFIILTSGMAFAEGNPSQTLDISKVFEEKGKLVVETKDGLHKVEMDSDLKQGDDYQIKLHKSSFLDGDKKILRRKLTLSEEAELKKLQFEAQSFYEKRDYGNAWSKVNAAQEIDPWNTQLINMKGTLLYLTGSAELALAYWQESLKIEDNQPFLKTTIERVRSTLKTAAPGAKAASQAALPHSGVKP